MSSCLSIRLQDSHTNQSDSTRNLNLPAPGYAITLQIHKNTFVETSQLRFALSACMQHRLVCLSLSVCLSSQPIRWNEMPFESHYGRPCLPSTQSARTMFQEECSPEVFLSVWILHNRDWAWFSEMSGLFFILASRLKNCFSTTISCFNGYYCVIVRELEYYCYMLRSMEAIKRLGSSLLRKP